MEWTMFAQLNRLARPAFAALALALVAVSAPPVTAGGLQGKPIFDNYDGDYDCQSVKQAIRYLKKRNYKMIEKLEKEAEEGIYLFSAKKKNAEHVFIPYYITYDACDREIVSRTPIKEEKLL
ncbi:MAG: hypothetical protein ABS47_17025 [Devosia sp. SCN 66-27]|jgi:hypothetical protein|nr:MAG: hypothetical protein ABS47_17025 [Devosia sp. SCN 66-27]